MEDKKKIPGWVVWCETLAQWDIIHDAGTKKERVEHRMREGSQILYVSRYLKIAIDQYKFYRTVDKFEAVHITEVENLPDWGSGRFVQIRG